MVTDCDVGDLILLLTRPYYNARRDSDWDTGVQQIIHDCACREAIASLPKTTRGLPAWLKRKLKSRYNSIAPTKEQYAQALQVLSLVADSGTELVIDYS